MEPQFVREIHSGDVKNFPGALSYQLFNETNSPINGFSAMFNEFTNDTYLKPGIHEDNEGFYVVEGSGSIQIANQEFTLGPGSAMIVPANTLHAIKKNSANCLKIFLFHFK